MLCRASALHIVNVGRVLQNREAVVVCTVAAKTKKAEASVWREASACLARLLFLFMPVGPAATDVGFLFGRSRAVSSRDVAFLFGFCLERLFRRSRFRAFKDNAARHGAFYFFFACFAHGVVV